MSKRKSNRMSERNSECMSKRMSTPMPKSMAKRIFECMSKRMSECMYKRMSKCMSIHRVVSMISEAAAQLQKSKREPQQQTVFDLKDRSQISWRKVI